MAVEVNIDGIIGPSHNYGGLSFGNLPSTNNRGQFSNPKDAALQGLDKMETLLDLGLSQAVLPPHERPHLQFLKSIGFQSASDAFTKSPFFFQQACSASYMWTANAATVCPSSDSFDGKVHFTTANLSHNLHRSIEAEQSFKSLKHIFADDCFVVHRPLWSHPRIGDEGAANHMRLCDSHQNEAQQIFVFGYSSLELKNQAKVFPPRQSLEASQLVAQMNQTKHAHFWQQNPAVIDQGVFHNDVIAVANENHLFFHEDSFASFDPSALKDVDIKYVKVTNKELSVEDCVKSYVFNSQLLTLKDKSMLILAPIECQQNDQVQALLNEIISDNSNAIKNILYKDIRQSMKNGGGPACLRLRVVLQEHELAKMHQGVLLNKEKIAILKKWVTKNYRDRIEITDLASNDFQKESQQALDELTQILNLGSNFYSFQKN